MVCRVEFADRAKRDLISIYAQVNAAESPAAARRFNGFEEDVSALALLPRRCPVAPEGRKAKIELMEKTVRIFNSFEEADAADALTRAQMTPQERVDIFCELRERANPDAFKQGLARVYRVLELERS